MIPTIGRYLYILNKERPYLELQHEKRKARLYLLGIITAVGLAVILFLTGCGGGGGYYPVAQQDYRTSYAPAYIPQPIQMPPTSGVFGSPGSSQTNPIYIAPGQEAGFPGGFH